MNLRGAHLITKIAPAIVLLSLVAGGCDKLDALLGKKTTPSLSPHERALQEVQGLVEHGQLDAALAKLATLPQGPDNLYWQGVVWAKRAEAAPAAETPDALKPEQVAAIESFEKALQAKPDHAPAALSLADLLAPLSLERNAPRPGARRRPAHRPTPSPSEPEPDMTPERVIGLYQQAAKADPKDLAALHGLIEFTKALKRFDDTDAAYAELLKRDNERAEPHVEYGDFLAADMKQPLKAIDQYNLALVWKDDPSTKDRIADLYIGLAVEHMARQEHMNAEARLHDAQKYLTGPSTPQAQKVAELLGKLRALRR
jgi:tetratricopeptide (TPR) repeat protein